MRGRPEDCLAGGGEMGALMREKDWSKTPLGPVATWPQSLRTSVSIMLSSGFALVVAWGPEFIFLYNDRYRPVLGATKHPKALGNRSADIFPEVWDFIGPLFRKALGGDAVALDDVLIPLDRNGYLEECFFTLSYSPIRDESGGVGGMLAIVTETTERFQGERRLRTLRDLAAVAPRAQVAHEACENAARTLGQNPTDVPFALIFLYDDSGTDARFVCRAGVDDERVADPKRWPLEDAARAGHAIVVGDLRERFGEITGGTYPEPTHTAVVLPLARPGGDRPYGFLVAGVCPRRALDDKYQGFFDLAAEHVATAITNALSHEAERKRAEALAEIDRAKTTFFSNVSHEFRTPLTLMLAPVEDLLARGVEHEQATLIHRNALRLLKLVNTLLDFSRIEAGRAQASFVPTNLSALTRDIASSFRAATARAGLELVIDCPDLSQEVYVDRDMWEKIVLNLVSNAFKFTFEGSIRVEMRDIDGHVELRVVDTGTGIAPQELPKVFERFHRIEGARSRSFEGSGIGLALVRELVHMHGGTVDVASEPGKGTTFTVTVSRTAAHLPKERLRAAPTLAPTGLGAAPYVEEALRWLSDDAPVASPRATIESLPAASPPSGPRPTIAVVDDNADMRAYLSRVLSACGDVRVYPDGAAALEAIRESPPDAVVTDVMMPNLDGFGLLQALRANPSTKATPIVMLSARAGEEARIEGATSGADDYIIKPFSARELVARVTAQIELSRLRGVAILERAALERANRAKDEFVAMLGHELRNPLAPITTALRVMELRGVSGGERERAIIRRQVEHLMRLVDDLLDVSRIASGKVHLDKEVHELADIVAQAIEVTSPMLDERHHRIDVSVPRGLPVMVDTERMTQVVCNLLTNACKYTNANGRISVEAQVDGAEVVLRIRDSGVGIEPDMLPRVFELFSQEQQSIDRSRGGLGLGLAIVRNLVQMHGGTVGAESAGRDKGSTFSVRLPLVAGRAEQASPPKAIAPSARRSDGRRVLIVDDNADAAEMLAEMLSGVGHVTRIAYDGPSALALLDEFTPDVALFDIGLPAMDGYELARRFRANASGAHARLFAVTGYGQDTDRARSRDAGFDAHFVKPLDIDAIIRAIDD